MATSMLPVQTVPYSGQQASYKPTPARSIFQNNFALQNIMQNANFTHLQANFNKNPPSSATSSSNISDSSPNRTFLKRASPEIDYGRLSKTNLYIKSLPSEADDEYLFKLCEPYGNIVSTKAILDPAQGNKCKGYGFVDFELAECAETAVRELNKKQIPAQMAKQQEQDPTNLYFSCMPVEIKEKDLEEILSAYGTVISTRILRDNENCSKGVGFARMEAADVCSDIITSFNNKYFKDIISEDKFQSLKSEYGTLTLSADPVVCKLADGGPKKRTQTFRKPTFGSNVHWSELPENATLFTAAPPTYVNAIHMPPQTHDSGASSSNTPPVSTYVHTPILNGAEAIAAIHVQQQHRAAMAMFQQQQAQFQQKPVIDDRQPDTANYNHQQQCYQYNYSVYQPHMVPPFIPSYPINSVAYQPQTLSHNGSSSEDLTKNFQNMNISNQEFTYNSPRNIVPNGMAMYPPPTLMQPPISQQQGPMLVSSDEQK